MTMLPMGVEPYSGWEARQEVIVWGTPLGQSNFYRGKSSPREVRRIERLTKTMVILDDDTRWKRESGASTVRRWEYDTSPFSYITPATDELKEELKRFRMVVRVQQMVDKTDFSKMTVAELNQVAAFCSKYQSEKK